MKLVGLRFGLQHILAAITPVKYVIV